MGELAHAIGGDKVDIHMIIPEGEEPHDFQPKSSDLTALSQARIFIINGCGLETWADKAVEAAGNEQLAVVTASRRSRYPLCRNEADSARPEAGKTGRSSCLAESEKCQDRKRATYAMLSPQLTRTMQTIIPSGIWNLFRKQMRCTPGTS